MFPTQGLSDEHSPVHEPEEATGAAEVAAAGGAYATTGAGELELTTGATYAVAASVVGAGAVAT
jgi:hypothetical protein